MPPSGGRRMGRHRAETSDTHLRRVQVPGRSRPRRRWPLATFVAVVLFAAGWFGWLWVHGRMVEHPAANVVNCPAGAQTIQLAVVPSIADVIGSAAAAYNNS